MLMSLQMTRHSWHPSNWSYPFQLRVDDQRPDAKLDVAQAQLEHVPTFRTCNTVTQTMYIQYYITGWLWHSIHSVTRTQCQPVNNTKTRAIKFDAGSGGPASTQSCKQADFKYCQPKTWPNEQKPELCETCRQTSFLYMMLQQANVVKAVSI